MKIQNVRLGMMVLLAANVCLLTGCHDTSAQSNQTAGDPLTMHPAPPVPQLPAVVTPAPATTVATVPAAAPLVPVVDFTPSASLADVIKLVRAGVNDELLRTFIIDTDKPFELGAPGIVYLHDLGMSDELINLMLQHDNQPPLVAQNPVTVAPQPPAAPAPVVEQEQPAPPPTEVVVEQPAPVTVNYLYSTLAPYGTWIEVDGYGRCWQPTVVRTQPGWRPYCDNGRWVYSNCGWYWASGYSWGAAFHYGRWVNHPSQGWCWTADTTWGPAWVSWRASSAYCGWAPLPPQSSWVAGVGLTYRGSAVSVGFNFGYSSDCYTFVPRAQFCARQPYQYALARPQVNQVINQTTIINNYSRGDNNRIVNHGIPRESFASQPGNRMAGNPRPPGNQGWNNARAIEPHRRAGGAPGAPGSFAATPAPGADKSAWPRTGGLERRQPHTSPMPSVAQTAPTTSANSWPGGTSERRVRGNYPTANRPQPTPASPTANINPAVAANPTPPNQPTRFGRSDQQRSTVPQPWGQSGMQRAETPRQPFTPQPIRVQPQPAVVARSAPPQRVAPQQLAALPAQQQQRMESSRQQFVPQPMRGPSQTVAAPQSAPPQMNAGAPVNGWNNGASPRNFSQPGNRGMNRRDR